MRQIIGSAILFFGMIITAMGIIEGVTKDSPEGIAVGFLFTAIGFTVIRGGGYHRTKSHLIRRIVGWPLTWFGVFMIAMDVFDSTSENMGIGILVGPLFALFGTLAVCGGKYYDPKKERLKKTIRMMFFAGAVVMPIIFGVKMGVNNAAPDIVVAFAYIICGWTVTVVRNYPEPGKNYFEYRGGLPSEPKVKLFEIELTDEYLFLHAIKRRITTSEPKVLDTYKIPLASILDMGILSVAVGKSARRFVRVPSLVDVMLFGSRGFLMGDLCEVEPRDVYENYFCIAYLSNDEPEKPKYIYFDLMELAGGYIPNRIAIKRARTLLFESAPSKEVMTLLKRAHDESLGPQLPRDDGGRIIL